MKKDINYFLGQKNVKAEVLNITISDYDMHYKIKDAFINNLKSLYQLKQYNDIKQKNILIYLYYYHLYFF